MGNPWEQAEHLASQSYAITIERDSLSDRRIVYLVRNRELPGCKAEGATLDQAKANLDDARVDYIHALLEEGLPIPEPSIDVAMMGVTDGEQNG